MLEIATAVDCYSIGAYGVLGPPWRVREDVWEGVGEGDEGKGEGEGG